MEISKVIDRIKKLQALASNNENEFEVRAAIKASDRLLDEYRITTAQIEAANNTSSEPMVRKTIAIYGNRSSYKESILFGLCDKYGACWYFQRTYGSDGGRHLSYIVCARESDLEILAYMYEYVIGEGEKLARNLNKGFGVGWSKSFLEGYGVGIKAQFKELQKASEQALAASNSSAMVILGNRKELATKFMNFEVKLSTAGNRLCGGRSSLDGWMRGNDEGKRVQINKGLNK